MTRSTFDLDYIRDYLINKSIGGIRGTSFFPYAITIDPCPILQSELDIIRDTAPSFGNILLNLSRNRPLLTDILADTAAADPFTAGLIKIMNTVSRDERVEVNVLRSDYFIDKDTGDVQQVELNCISSGLACLSERANAMHQYIHPELHTVRLPSERDAVQLMFDAAVARAGVARPTVLFVVQGRETNRCDQRAHEIGLNELGARTMRRTLTQLADATIFDGDLVVDDAVIDMVYFRAGYGPEDYPTDREWAARAAIEQSSAAKLPTVPMQLVGAKKVQQALCDETLLAKVLDEDEADSVRRVFAPMGALPPEPDAFIQDVLAHPADFVLKPQREGGGHNVFGAEVGAAIRDLYAGKGDRDAWIVMKRIRPRVESRRFVGTDGEVAEAGLVAEIGPFIGVLAVDGEVKVNQMIGMLVRSKPENVDEGGVMSGVAIFDTLYVVD
ncbi:Glutathione synthase, eukaryotic [Carpediemonas membranifera]|uniref:Glutathione synthetase n=1 Tax=Carpediemonas membranifera TaxID=201153 RepID=A0A8J6AWF2_9EUKA|nr:Glutathione synthase, eukaryotic [Carpediemonas membranifera]|eukprot:KAG9394205.1 Glutathione synthase, eukaryotic [Carpediemonas membranifera]